MTGIITIDGLAGVGKSEVAMRLGKSLGWHVLHSGLLYRYIAYQALSENSVDNLNTIPQKWQDDLLSIRSYHSEEGTCILVNEQDVTQILRREDVARTASLLAQRQNLRDDLVTIQRHFCQPPGLVAEGRDMASVIFPEAQKKVFLSASVKVRAERRYKQLIMDGNSVNMADIVTSIERRDKTDHDRASQTLKAHGAIVIDTDGLTLEECLQTIVNR
mgnify:CR=1 FL=1